MWEIGNGTKQRFDCGIFEEGFLTTMTIKIMMIRSCLSFCSTGLTKGLVLESITIHSSFS